MPEYNYRENRKYIQQRHINQKYSNSFYPYFTKTWNNLTTDTKKLDIIEFKSKIKQDFKPSKYKHFSKGNKYSNALLTRIRLQRSHLNAHQFEVGLAQSPKCLCESPHENSVHYLTQCFLYTEERRILYDQVEQIIPKFRSLNMKRQFEILTEGSEKDNPEMKYFNSKLLIWTQQFILKTKRFSK